MGVDRAHDFMRFLSHTDYFQKIVRFSRRVDGFFPGLKSPFKVWHLIPPVFHTESASSCAY